MGLHGNLRAAAELLGSDSKPAQVTRILVVP